MTLNSKNMSRVALRYGIIFTKFKVSQAISSRHVYLWCWYTMSRRDLDLWP